MSLYAEEHCRHSPPHLLSSHGPHTWPCRVTQQLAGLVWLVKVVGPRVCTQGCWCRSLQ